MRVALLLALSLCVAGVALVAPAPEAAACIPPNCPGFGGCRLTLDREDPLAGTDFECYY